MKRTVWLVLDSNNQPINGVVHATENTAKGFRLGEEEIVPARLYWGTREKIPKLCLRKVVSRKKIKGKKGPRWALSLICGHSQTRAEGVTHGRGAIIKQAQCDACFLEGKRTGDAV